MLEKVKSIIEKLPPWILTAFTAVAILWLTLATHPLGNMKPELFPGADKLAHALMFGGLTLMIYTDRSRSLDWSRLSVGFVIEGAAISLAFGVFTELLQGTMSAGRTSDIFDILADGTGSLLVALLWLLFSRFHHHEPRH